MKEGEKFAGVEIVYIKAVNIAPENVENGKRVIKVGNNNFLIG